MPTPVYRSEDLNPAFHLRYTWTGLPTVGTSFPPQPDPSFFQSLDRAWLSDNLKRISVRWSVDKIQLGFSTIPVIAPILFVARVKGRLQHAFRQARMQVKFSRKVAFRAIGKNRANDVRNYIARQVEKERFVDARFAAMLRRFTVADAQIALNQPTPSNSGRYWYNLHLVLTVVDRGRYCKESDFEKLDRMVIATARNHRHQIAARAWMPDHLHLAIRGNIMQSPSEIALGFMNNTAFAMGQNAIWQHGFYAGTFSEYDVRALGDGEK